MAFIFRNSLKCVFIFWGMWGGSLLAQSPEDGASSVQVVRLKGVDAPIRFHFSVPGAGLFPDKFTDKAGADEGLQGKSSEGEDPDAGSSEAKVWDCEGIRLTGAIMKRKKTIDRFRYDYYPGNPALEKDPVWLVFERFLKPGVYTLKLELYDCDGNLAQHLTQSFTAGPYHQNGVQALPELPNYPLSSHSIRIIPPGDYLMVNKAKIEARTLGEGIARVRFLLDGKPVAEKAKPPNKVTLNLNGPRMRMLRAEALDGDGYLLARDELKLNQGPYAFSVRLLEPVEGRFYKGAVMARAEVQTPPDRKLDRVDFFLGDQLAATIFDEPFNAPIPIPSGEGPFLLKASAHLSNGETAWDTVLFNNEGIVESLQVREVELLVGVSDLDQKAVLDLKKDDFTVLEDGKPQVIQHFEVARNLPVNLIFLTDVSRSMFISISPILKGSKEMIDSFIGPGDRAGIMVFQNRPRMLVPFTNDHRDLFLGLQRVAQEAETSEILGSGIYDSIAGALHFFGGVKGRRALVVFTDGEDNRSTYALEDTLNFARQSEVRVYVVKLHRPYKDEEDAPDVLEQLVEQTGGAFYHVKTSLDLYDALGEIATELRTQYLLRYQTSGLKFGGDCRKIDIKLGRRGLKARTMGYVCP